MYIVKKVKVISINKHGTLAQIKALIDIFTKKLELFGTIEDFISF